MLYALGARGRRAAGVSRGGTLGLGLYALKSGALESAQILKFSKVCHGIPFEDITSNKQYPYKSFKSRKRLYGADLVTGCLARSTDIPCVL